LLDMINSENCFQIGLTTDYMLECILHVRTVEVDNHDPARTPGVVRALIERLHVLYRDAFVAVRAPLGGPRMMTEIVMSQLSEARAIHYNGKVKLLYDANTKDSAKRAMARMNVVVDVVEKRLQADFNQAALESCVEGMFLVEWAEVTTSAARLGVLKQYIRRLFRALRLDPVAGLNAFLDVVPHVVEHGRQVAARDGIDFRDLDLRDIWEIVVLGSLPTVQQQNIELVVPLSDLYSSLEDATGTVERNLGMVRRMLDSHNGPMQPDGSTLSSLVEYALDGPRTEEELFSKGEGGELLLNGLSRELCTAWVFYHGRCFGRMREFRSDKGKHHVQTKKSGATLMDIKRGRTEASNRLLAVAAEPSIGAEETCVAGVRRACLLQPKEERMQNNPHWNEAFDQYNATTANKLARVRKRVQQRLLQSKPTVPRLLGGIGPPSTIAEPLRVVAPPKLRTAVAWLASAPKPLAEKTRYNFIGKTVKEIAKAHVVVLDDLTQLEDASDVHSVVRLLYIICLGKAVLSAKDWCGDAPENASTTLHLQPAVKLFPRELILYPAMESEHLLIKALTEVCKLPDSKWTLIRKSEADKALPTRLLDSKKRIQSVSIRELADVVELCRITRSMRLGRGASGMYRRLM
jgi:hypothetical protein